MVIDVKRVEGLVPGLFDVMLDNGMLLRDLTAAQVDAVIRKEGTPAMSAADWQAER